MPFVDLVFSLTSDPDRGFDPAFLLRGHWLFLKNGDEALVCLPGEHTSDCAEASGNQRLDTLRHRHIIALRRSPGYGKTPEDLLLRVPLQCPNSYSRQQARTDSESHVG
jgi:hypothetical protein